MKRRLFFKKIDKQGAGLIIAILVLGLMLSVGVSIMIITNLQTKMSLRSGNSSIAYQYADSAAEYALAMILRAKRVAISECRLDSSCSAPSHLRIQDSAHPSSPKHSAFHTAEDVFSGARFQYTLASGKGFIADVYLLDSDMNNITNVNTQNADDVFYLRSVGIVNPSGSETEVRRSILVPVPVVPGESGW